jgi:hypothetical protein
VLLEVSDPDPRMHVHNVLQGLAHMGAPAERVVPFVHGLTDFIPRNITGGDPFYWKYIARDEDELHSHLKSKTSGKGFTHDPPVIGRAISETLSKYPELQQLYHGR